MAYVVGRMDRGEAEALQDRFWRGVATWIAAGGVGVLLALALLFASLPLGHALADGPRAGLELATMWMGVSLSVVIASTATPMIGIATRWLSWQDRLAEAGRVLAERAPTAPAWDATNRRLRLCLDRTANPEVRASLERLHDALWEAVRAASTAGSGTDADLRARELLVVVDVAVRDLLASGRPSDLRDALALLDTHAELDAMDLGRMAHARAMAARRRQRT